MNPAGTSAGSSALQGVVAPCLRHPLLIACTVALLLALAFAGASTRTPVWRAEATLVLKQEQRGPDGEAAAETLTAAGELARLGARAPAEETVRAPFDGRPPAPENPDAGRHLGLSTTVDDPSLLPLCELWRRLLGRPLPSARLFARAWAELPGAPSAVRVRFLTPARVRVALPSLAGDAAARDFDWQRGCQLAYGGLALVLEPRGDVVGRDFLVHVQDESEALRDLLQRVEVSERGEGSGVLVVSALDTDPHRAAETANAIARNYLALGLDRARQQRAAERERLSAELDRARVELDQAFSELVHLRSAQPLSIDAAESARLLLVEVAELEATLARQELELAEVEDALADVGAGRLDGLARLAPSTPDATTRVLIEELALVSARARVAERGEADGHETEFDARLFELEAERGATLRETNELAAALAALRAEGRTALSRLGGTGGVEVDQLTSVLVEEVAVQSAKRDQLVAADYTAVHPDVVALDAAVRDHLGRIEQQLEGRLAGLRARLASHDELVDTARKLAEAQPEAERREIDAALERLVPLVQAHLGCLRDALAQRAAASEAEIERLRASLVDLSASERSQVSALQRVEERKARVALLTSALEEARTAEAFVEPPAELVNPAIPPLAQSSPRIGRSLVLAAILGLVLGASLAQLRERAFGRIQRAEELCQALGAPVLGLVPDFRRVAPRVRDLEALRAELASERDGALASCYRSLRASLRAAARRESFVVAVTSALAREGKSATAIGLANALADAGMRTLLVRAAAEPREPARGLYPSLAGLGDWRHAVKLSTNDNMHVLPAGVAPRPEADLLASEAAEALFLELGRSYDAVVVDLPALAAGAEVEALAPHCSGIVVVARRGRVSQRLARQAAERIRRAGGHVQGGVLNAAGRAGFAKAQRRQLDVQVDAQSPAQADAA